MELASFTLRHCKSCIDIVLLQGRPEGVHVDGSERIEKHTWWFGVRD